MGNLVAKEEVGAPPTTKYNCSRTQKTAAVATERGGVSCWDESYGLKMNQPFSELKKTFGLTAVIGKYLCRGH